MFVGEDLFVNELLHLLDVDHRSSQGVHGCVLPMTEDTQEQMVRCYAVTSCPHCLFAGEVYYRIELVRYADFHIFSKNKSVIF